ncbi:MAG: VanZ family protein [Sporolactobacillus sp.]
MLRNKRAFWFWVIMIILVIGMIYKGSATPYAQQDIKPFLRAHFVWTAETFPNISFNYGGEWVSSAQPYAFFEFVVRKASHVSEYFLLTFMMINLFMTTVMSRGLCYLSGSGLAFIYALFDEWHQKFVPGRTGHLIDACTFDLSGMILAMIAIFLLDIYFLFFYTSSQRNFYTNDQTLPD